MTIEFKIGSIWKLVGSDDPDSLVGAPPAGVVFSEWALSNPSAWAYLAPILAENDGWADFITTPRGRNHVKSMWDGFKDNPNWFCQTLTVKDTGFPIHLVEEQRQEYHRIFGEDAGDALIDQEYWCSFEAAILGAFWGKELAQCERTGRIGKVDVNPDLPIHTVWDLGKGANMAIWVFQVHANQIRIVDFLKGFGIGFPTHVAELDRRGYKGGDDWVPHDAKVPELGTGRTRIESLIALGRKPRLVPDHKKMDGINAARMSLPRCWFDEKRCKEGLEALRQYRAEWDDGKKAFKDTEVHDWTSHPADAFRYLCMAWREIVPQPDPEDPLKNLLKPKTLNDYLEEYDMERAED